MCRERKLQMDSTIVIAIIGAVFLAWFLIPRRRHKLPPGPYPFPIIGNILQLGRQPHQSLANLSKSYGPLMSLQLGSIYTVVASSPESAKLVLQENDRVFSGRTVPAAMEVHAFDTTSVATIPTGDKWRKVRKLMREQMFSTHPLEAGEGLRQEKMRKLLEYVHECSINERAVNLGEAAFVTSLNLLTVTFFSVDLTEFDSDDTQQLKETVAGFTKIAGAPNVADFFPFLKRFDPQGIKRQSELQIGKLLAILQGIVNTRLESRSSSVVDSPRKNDMLDTLLDSVEGSEYDLSLREIYQFFLDLLLGGSDTIPGTVEWAMTELLVNPEKMVKAKNEVRNVIGSEKKLEIEESDISRLPYLRALIKETLRLHPPAPLLFSRRADREVEMGGYTIPQNTQIFVNVWSIGRDSNVWANPNSFEPERFLDELNGQDFKYLPFGSGRRVCPGSALADRMVPLMVASLIHKFDWKVEEEVDTTEEFGVVLHKALPLKAIPVMV